ncbi:MAG: CoA pyrophosphatase [Corynebacterium sp.]|nr:CoA pyrophosphatase [Corynebacterium sp.]
MSTDSSEMSKGSAADDVGSPWPHWVRALDSQEFERALSARLPLRRPFAAQKKAAICILCTGDTHEDARVILTHREPAMRQFSGHISFPGGHIDRTDITPIAAGLREANEEIALDPDSVKVIRQIRPVAVRTARYPVYPVLCWWDKPHAVYAASPEEVDEVLTVRLADLADLDNCLHTRIGHFKAPAFWCEGYLIWGFTAGLLATMLEISGWHIAWEQVNSYDLKAALARSRNQERNSQLDR